jgi:acyl transferase domain-containing protein
MSKRQRAVVVFPGRGVYGKDEMGYFKRLHPDLSDWLLALDAWRTARGRDAISTLDQSATYAARSHASSENASALIYACALADFEAIDQDRFEIVAITGNSLGWYLALAGAGVLQGLEALQTVDEMGQIMAAHGRGGQIVTSLVDADWHFDPAKQAAVEAAIHSAKERGGAAQWSIHLGGTGVLGGDEKGLSALEQALPSEPPFPFRLARHSAFHTALLDHVPPLAQEALKPGMFHQPVCPVIDGRGTIWRQSLSDLDGLYGYTFGHQLTEPYDFTAAIRTALREYAPDCFILTGPGTNLGGAIAQSVIAEDLWEWKDKASFISAQKDHPRLLSMGQQQQRAMVVRS